MICEFGGKDAKFIYREVCSGYLGLQFDSSAAIDQKRRRCEVVSNLGRRGKTFTLHRTRLSGTQLIRTPDDSMKRIYTINR